MKTELGITSVCGQSYEFSLVEETSEVEVRIDGGCGIYMLGKLVNGEQTNLPEEFDDAVRRLLRSKPH